MYVPVLALTLAARWAEYLRDASRALLVPAWVLSMLAGGLLFNYGLVEERGRLMLAGIQLGLSPVALGFLVFWWRWS